MSGTYYLGLDSGTAGTTALVMDENWNVKGRGHKDMTQYYPEPGWVEHDPMEIWDCALYAASEACKNAGIEAKDLRCIGIANQGETILLWDKTTGMPVHNAIVWQDRRTAKYAESITDKYGNMVREKTGLMIDSYFSATKIRWILDNVPGVKEKVAEKKILAGTVDTWLIWKLTHGKAFVTDITTASRTMLLNIHTGEWDQDILEALGIDESMLAEVCDCATIYGTTDPLDFFGAQIPVSGSTVDQQSALFGQACFAPGTIKCTYSSGCFLMMNTGDKPVYSRNGILTTVAWGLQHKTTYALEGGVYVTGEAVRWLRDGMGILDTKEQAAEMAVAAGDNGGVYFVPAFFGLAAPHWDSYARGMIIGITGGTTREQIVRACLEATAYQVRDNLDVMKLDANIPITTMRADGKYVGNEFLMQFQADMLGMPVDLAAIHESRPLGAAYLAALGIGDCQSLEDIQSKWKVERTYEPRMSVDQRESLMYKWHKAVNRAKDWAED